MFAELCEMAGMRFGTAYIVIILLGILMLLVSILRIPESMGGRLGILTGKPCPAEYWLVCGRLSVIATRLSSSTPKYRWQSSRQHPLTMLMPFPEGRQIWETLSETLSYLTLCMTR